MPSESRLRRRLGAIGGVLLIGTVLTLGSGNAALAGADAGTYAKGKVITPTASPYISYSNVTECRGFAGGAFIWQSRAQLGTDVATGPVYTVTDGDSTVSLRKVGTYTGSWRCINKAGGTG